MIGTLQFFARPVSEVTPATQWLAFIVEIAVKGTMILVAAYGISMALRQASAATRHLVWTTTLGALLALPLLSLALPAWRITLPGSTAAIPAVPAQTAGAPQKSGLVIVPGAQTDGIPVTRTLGERTRSDLLWAGWVVLAWGAGLALALARLAVASVRVRSMARRGLLVSGTGLELADGLSEQFGLPRAVTVVESDEVGMPMASGVIRPIILLPASATAWPLERLREVQTHELAHIKRRDCLSQLLGQLACSIYWFHPLAWLAAKLLREERERASDDLVLSLGIQPADYAEHLVELARDLRPTQIPWSAAVAMAQPSKLESRVKAVLNPTANRKPLSLRAGVLAITALATVAVPLAALQASAGKETGQIRGTAYDPSGAVVPDATVRVSNIQSKEMLTGSTNQEGVYAFPALPVGHYDLEISHPGFTLVRRQGVVPPGGTLRLDVTLGSLAPLTQDIEVVAKAPPRTASYQGRKHELGPRVPHRIRVGGDVQAAKLISQVKPVYPPEAVEKGIEGTVLMNAVISMDGAVYSLRVINEPDRALAKAAVAAVQLWRYSPTLLNGAPVEVVTTISVNFRLED